MRLTDLRACFSRLCAAGALGLLPALWMPPSADAFVTSADDQPLLFGTLEFRGLSGGGWYDFPQKVAETLDLFSRCADSADTCENPEVVEVLRTAAAFPTDDPHRMLTAVNDIADRLPYRSDLANYRRREHWASPVEFLTYSGDCEDSAIFKYALLRHLGVPAHALRIVLVERKADALGHAVLAVYLGDQVYILDGFGAPVRPQSEVTDYSAVFSFNETARWAHIARLPQSLALSADQGEGVPGDRLGAGLHTSQLRPLAPSDPALFLQLYRKVFAAAGTDRSGYRVQLGAFRSLEIANRVWQEVWRSQWDLLAGSDPRIESRDRAAGGQLHLLQIGALPGADKAEALCRNLSARGVDCLVVEPS